MRFNKLMMISSFIPSATPFYRRVCEMSTSNRDIESLRVSYTRTAPTTKFATDPHVQFQAWFDDALKCASALPSEASFEANAMCLSTVNAETSRPSARMVLLKGCDQRGFIWYTHYTSRKGVELTTSPFAALTFWWPHLERSVRIEGKVEKLPESESDAYFASRPPLSRLGAVVSTQSAPIDSSEELHSKYDTLCAQHPDGNVPRPRHWGGYLLRPDYYEFWKGREARLHDRIVYDLDEVGDWGMKRLQP